VVELQYVPVAVLFLGLKAGVSLAWLLLVVLRRVPDLREVVAQSVRLWNVVLEICALVMKPIGPLHR
jgi:hypothetical protein